MAVAFFFVLGGFSMTLGYKDKVTKSDFNYQQFLTRRCIKFYPLHWLCLMLAMPLALLSFSWFDVPKLILNVALLQTWIPIMDYYFSFNWVSWYLADTMIFAVVFPFVFKWIDSATTKKKVMMVMVMAIIYTFVVLMISGDLFHAILYISPYMRLMDFIFGILLAITYLNLIEKLQVTWSCVKYQIVIFSLIVFLVVESCLLSEKETFFAPVYWIPIALLIIITSLSERGWGGHLFLKNKYIVKLGELSFIFFMIHQIILRYTWIIFEKILYIDTSVIIYIVFTLVLTLIASIIIDKHFLKPITQWLTKRTQRSMIAHS